MKLRNQTGAFLRRLWIFPVALIMSFGVASPLQASDREGEYTSARVRSAAFCPQKQPEQHISDMLPASTLVYEPLRDRRKKQEQRRNITALWLNQGFRTSAAPHFSLWRISSETLCPQSASHGELLRAAMP